MLAVLALMSAAAGVIARQMPTHPAHPYWRALLVVGGVGTALAVLAAIPRQRGSAAVVQRWADRSDHHGGVASPRTIRRVAGRRAMRRRAAVLLPHLRGAGVLTRWRTPTRAYATPLVRSGGVWLWSSAEDVTLRVGGPRTGKTGEIACRILDAPGAVIATSTRTDLIKLTAYLRARKGPVRVFNPTGFAGVPTTLPFDPVAGCADINLAAERAADLLASSAGPGDGKDREYWSGQAERVLRCLMHAAALGDASMHDVLGWVADPDVGAAEVRRLLRRSPVRAVEHDALQFFATNDKTRSSICSTVMPALGWLSVPGAAEAATGGAFDVADLLASGGTVYLLGGEDATVAPLVTALTGHIAREARRIAGLQPEGRLDPPLTLVLDEAALICPIPLDRWTADMGGRNITIHVAAQSRAQLRQRWGDTGAAAIMNNAATLLIFGGTRDPDDLRAYATLTGERLEQARSYDASGRTTSITYRRVPVLTPAQIAQLPEGNVIAIRRGLPPVVGTTVMAWERRDVRAALRRASRRPRERPTRIPVRVRAANLLSHARALGSRG